MDDRRFFLSVELMLKSGEREIEWGQVEWVKEVAGAEAEEVEDGVAINMEDCSALFATSIIDISNNFPITSFAAACCQQSAHVYS